jgi:pantothenate kinase
MSQKSLNLNQGLKRAHDLLENSTDRTILGIVGKPGSGKSTVSQFLIDNLPTELVALVPMDGYHLSNEELISLGRRDRKGAPDTFDIEGFAKLLTHARSNQTEITFPVFHREIEASLADEGLIKTSVKLVITEGNYLLHNLGGWEQIAPLLSETWFVDVDDALRRERLIARHIKYGKQPEAARAWAMGTDEANAALIAEGRSRADYLITLES